MGKPALSMCRCCHESVSTEASTCPPCGQPYPTFNEHTITPEVLALVVQGKKIEAIKLLVKRTGMGLLEAKSLVDSLPPL
jgi:ribosomal protein L7/L12